MAEFYRQRDYRPAWSRVTSVYGQAGMLLRAVGGATSEGLDSQAYRLARAEELVQRLQVQLRRIQRLDAHDRATLDLLLTNAFLAYGTHLVRGRVDPGVVHRGWSLAPRHTDLTPVLKHALASDAFRRARRDRPSSASSRA